MSYSQADFFLPFDHFRANAMLFLFSFHLMHISFSILLVNIVSFFLFCVVFLQLITESKKLCQFENCFRMLAVSNVCTHKVLYVNWDGQKCSLTFDISVWCCPKQPFNIRKTKVLATTMPLAALTQVNRFYLLHQDFRIIFKNCMLKSFFTSEQYRSIANQSSQNNIALKMNDFVCQTIFNVHTIVNMMLHTYHFRFHKFFV